MRDGLVAFVVNWVLPGAAIIAFWVCKGATPGKMAISAVVVDAETHAPRRLLAGARRATSATSSPRCRCSPGLAWVAFDARKQGWHDKMARTVVIYRPR